MSVELACLMAVTAALLTLSVCAVLWRGKGSAPASEAADAPAAPLVLRPSMTMPAAEDAEPEDPIWAPPETALLAAQLEVNQTFHVRTRNSLYVLTLRDPVLGLYDAVRTGPKSDGTTRTERFKMHFSGTFVPHLGLRYGAFVRGGNLSYRKDRGQGIEHVSPSSPIERILFSIPESYKQAS